MNPRKRKKRYLLVILDLEMATFYNIGCRYATPLRIGQTNRQKVEPHPNNPASWNNLTLRQWVASTSNGKIDPDVLCPYESGMQVSR
jgi:hypothetical protein